MLPIDLYEFTDTTALIRLLIALVASAILGIERTRKLRPAGMRTYMLVCIGACSTMLGGLYLYETFGPGFDPARMAAQVISGIGFIGAGTIMVTPRQKVKGLTTAAGLWTAAGVGLAIGIGFYEAAIVSTLAIFVIMSLMQIIDAQVQKKSKSVELYVELESTCPLGDFLRQIREKDIEIRDIQHENSLSGEQGVRSYLVFLKLKKRQRHIEIMEDIRSIPGIAYLESF